jgi:hypothetical protein
MSTVVGWLVISVFSDLAHLARASFDPIKNGTLVCSSLS